MDIAVAGSGQVAGDAADDAAMRTAATVAAGYTAPEPQTAVTRLLASSATTPSQVAARLDDPADPLYIDPADTSDSAHAAREAVVTMLCSSDLSDTQGLDAWVAATCSREHGEKVAAASVERAKDLHVQTDEFAAVASNADVAKAVRVTGRALSVGTGIRAAHMFEDRVRERTDATNPHYRSGLLIAADDAHIRAVHDGFYAGSDAETARAAMVEAVTGMVEQARDDTSHKEAVDAVETVMGVYTTAFPEAKKIEDITFDDVKRFHDLVSEETTAQYDARRLIGDIAGETMPDDFKAEYMADWWDRIDALQARTQDENQDQFSRNDYNQVCRAALIVAALSNGDIKSSGDSDTDWTQRRYGQLTRAVSDFVPSGTDDAQYTAWFDAVRDTLNEVSPRFEDAGQFDAISAKNSQARKKDVDEVKRALSLYSQRDMEKFYADFGKDEWGQKTVEYLYVEKSKKRAHFRAYGTVKIDTPGAKAYLSPGVGTLEEFLQQAESTDRPYRMSIKGTSYARTDTDDDVYKVPDVAFLPQQGEDDFEERTQRMQDLVDRYNALPVEDRQRIVGHRRKSGFRLMVDTKPVEVYGKDGKEVKQVAYIRATTQLPKGNSKTFTTASTVRVGMMADTTHHEVAHMVDHYVGVNNDIAQEFLRERIDGLDEVHYRGGDAGEKVVADGFYNEYVGKTSYGTRASEVNSMGVEVLMHSPYQARDVASLPKHDGKPVVSFAPAMLDPEHHDHTLGLLAGTPRTFNYDTRSGDVSGHNARVMKFLNRPDGGEFAGQARVYVPSFEDDGTRMETAGMKLVPLQQLREMAQDQPSARHALDWLCEHSGGDNN